MDARFILYEPRIQAAFAQAWWESIPGPTGGHEEGGFTLRASDGSLVVRRWAHGERNTIQVPSHEGCRSEEKAIVASFHTHPNTGPDYLQEPGETDKRAVWHDPHLREAYYVGEFVISEATIYLIASTGTVLEMVETARYLVGAEER